MAEELLTLPNQKSSIKWTKYLAIGIAEGFEEHPNDVNAKEEEIDAEAWAIIIKYKLYQGLQGWFGRNAKTIIDNHIIDEDGTIYYENIYL